MPTSNLAAVAQPMTDNARYCRYRGCGRTYVRRYVPSYDYYATPYYNDYGPSYSYYGDMARTADTGMAIPGISRGLWRRHVNEAILETIALTRSEMRQHGILLKTELANDVPQILGDRVQLQQVILNLIMNAIEAMSESSEVPRELLIRS